MAKPKKEVFISHEKNIFKKTSTSGKSSMIKRSSMNKSKKASYKAYRGQGR
jgi:hypothetical protein